MRYFYLICSVSELFQNTSCFALLSTILLAGNSCNLTRRTWAYTRHYMVHLPLDSGRRKEHTADENFHFLLQRRGRDMFLHKISIDETRGSWYHWRQHGW